MAATNDPNEPRNDRPPERQVPAPLSETPRPATFLGSLQRRFGPAVGLAVLLAVGAAAGVWFGAPEPKHTVRTRLRNPPGNPLLRNVERVPAIEDHQRNEIALATSAIVFATALRDPAVAKLSRITEMVDPVVWLERNVQVDFSVAPEIMQISMSGYKTDELQVLVKAVRDAYLTEVVERDRSVRLQRSQFLRDLIQKYEDRLKLAREAQKELAANIGGKNANVRARVLAFMEKKLARSEQDLLDAQSELRKVRLGLRILEEQANEPVEVPEAVIQDALNKDTELGELRARVRVLSTQIEEVRERTVRPEEAVPELQKEVEAVNKQIQAVTDRLRPQIVKQGQKQVQGEARNEIRGKAARIANLERLVAELEQEVRGLTQNLAAFVKQEDKVDLATEGVEHIEKLVKQFRADEVALQIELAVPNRITRLEDVTVQRADGRSGKVLMAGGAALGAFCLALFGVACLEHRHARAKGRAISG